MLTIRRTGLNDYLDGGSGRIKGADDGPPWQWQDKIVLLGVAQAPAGRLRGRADERGRPRHPLRGDQVRR